MLVRDVDILDTHPTSLLLEKHCAYLAAYSQNKDGYEQVMVEYLRMSGMYWGMTAMDVINHLPELGRHSKSCFICNLQLFVTGSREEILVFIKACQHESGGISASVGHDPHMLYTLSAVQILTTYDAIDKNLISTEKVVSYIKSLQQADGSFYGDKWGEVDLRFSFCAIAALALLDKLQEIDIESAVNFIMKCNNGIDGGFGSRPGSESHAGLIYCALGALSLTGRLDLVDAELLGMFRDKELKMESHYLHDCLIVPQVGGCVSVNCPQEV